MSKISNIDTPNIVCINFDHLNFIIDDIYLLEYSSDEKGTTRSLILQYKGFYDDKGEVIYANLKEKGDPKYIKDTALVFFVISTNHNIEDEGYYNFNIGYRNYYHISELTKLS